MFCCDQSRCTTDSKGHKHSSFLGTFEGSFADCFKKCDETQHCGYVTTSKAHGGHCGACFLEQVQRPTHN